jgi:hypothetical protein
MIIPIIPRHQITNRHDRRLFEQESKRISDQLLPIPIGFLNRLFNGDEDYIPLYNEYNSLWQLGCEACKGLHPKLKVCDPNPFFFESSFKPLENIQNHVRMDRIYTIIRKLCV